MLANLYADPTEVREMLAELARRLEQRNAQWDELREWLNEFPGEEAPGWAVIDKMNELTGTAPEEEK